MSDDILYIDYEEVLDVYASTIEKSGGGFSGVRDEGGIRSVIDFMQNDLYYPDFTAKLSYLVFRFCSGHFFNDGNKRIALTLGAYFLHKNKQTRPISDGFRKNNVNYWAFREIRSIIPHL